MSDVDAARVKRLKEWRSRGELDPFQADTIRPGQFLGFSGRLQNGERAPFLVADTQRVCAGFPVCRAQPLRMITPTVSSAREIRVARYILSPIKLPIYRVLADSILCRSSIVLFRKYSELYLAEIHPKTGRNGNRRGHCNLPDGTVPRGAAPPARRGR
jgi:hypothetical protein